MGNEVVRTLMQQLLQDSRKYAALKLGRGARDYARHLVSDQTAGNANNCRSTDRKPAKTGLASDMISLVSSYGF